MPTSNEKASSQTETFIFARSKTAETVMNATGWNGIVVNANAILVDSIFFYVFDYKTKWIWSCSVPRESFNSVIEKCKSINNASAVACCSQMISECSVSRDEQKENDLAISLTMYISITKTFQLTEKAKKANHFLVIRYGQSNTIRPFAMKGSPKYFLSSEDVQNSFRSVAAMDLSNHPNWANNH